jgi:hypothetical protein
MDAIPLHLWVNNHDTISCSPAARRLKLAGLACRVVLGKRLPVRDGRSMQGGRLRPADTALAERSRWCRNRGLACPTCRPTDFGDLAVVALASLLPTGDRNMTD